MRRLTRDCGGEVEGEVGGLKEARGDPSRKDECEGEERRRGLEEKYWPLSCGVGAVRTSAMSWPKSVDGGLLRTLLSYL